MKHETQVKLLDEILGLLKQKSAYLDEKVTHSDHKRYIDQNQFQKEQKKIFLGNPILIAHSSELPEEGSFIIRDCFGIPILITRDRDGNINSFYNVCRHRGARLVEDTEGCKHRFTCPYHAWTWDNQGRLIAAPHKEQGFPNLNMKQYGLKQINSTEQDGWIWCDLTKKNTKDSIAKFLKPIQEDIKWLKAEEHEIHDVNEKVWKCNWKILVEGGLEAYHFRVAHAKTIASMFHDNLSTYQVFGKHIRSILARITVDELVEVPRKKWKIREHANVLYNIYPNTAWLVQADHIVLIQFFPTKPNETKIRCVMLRPKQTRELTKKQRSYWDKNHELTTKTLDEDFGLGEKIQANLKWGVNQKLTFGRFEGALKKFNQIVDKDIRRVNK